MLRSSTVDITGVVSTSAPLALVGPSGGGRPAPGGPCGEAPSGAAPPVRAGRSAGGTGTGNRCVQRAGCESDITRWESAVPPGFRRSGP